MKMSHIVERVFTGRLTCSEVMGILMDQPTRTGESHAHMHMTEGFRPDQRGFGGDDFSFERKRTNWENPAHLYPAGAPEFQHTRYVYPDTQSPRAYGYYHGAWQDPDRLATDRSYVNRTGLAELPAVMKKKYTAYRFDTLNAAPTAHTVDSLDDLRGKTIGRNVGEYQAKSSRESGVMRVIEREEQEIPLVRASPAHTMFPDGESLVMHLTAALMSDAGKRVIRHLFWNMMPGQQATVAIFSNSAVDAVKAVDTTVASTMLERTLEVDMTVQRDKRTGFFPATGRVNTASSAIDHVVAILGYRATGELNVITCYPSKVSTLAAYNTATLRNQDIAELQFGVHTVVQQQNPLPRLTW